MSGSLAGRQPFPDQPTTTSRSTEDFEIGRDSSSPSKTLRAAVGRSDGLWGKASGSASPSDLRVIGSGDEPIQVTIRRSPNSTKLRTPPTSRKSLSNERGRQLRRTLCALFTYGQLTTLCFYRGYAAKRRFADVHCAQGRAVASELPEHLATQWEKLADGVARLIVCGLVLK
jgi:hypothetical protein